jgi:acetyl esterase/lipase
VFYGCRTEDSQVPVIPGTFEKASSCEGMNNIMPSLSRVIFVSVLIFIGRETATAAEQNFKRTEDVIYGRKYGMALTMDVFTPPKTNGAAIIFVVCGGWMSLHKDITPSFFSEPLKRGFTVFAVVLAGQPKFTIPEMVSDLNRAVRYIRYHAAEYGVDPKRFGISGCSAGAHLALLQGVAGTLGDVNAQDPINRESSRVQAVACVAGPTDFLNYGKEDAVQLGTGVLKDYAAPFDFQTFDKTAKRFNRVTDEAERRAIAKQISPITYVSSDDPPVLIVHGDADEIVPIQQSKKIIEKLRAVGVKAELMVKPGAGHVFLLPPDMFAGWFEEILGSTGLRK